MGCAGSALLSFALACVQDVCGDYFAALKAYRQMQALLGPKATQAARRLSSSSTKSLGAAARLALYDENVGMLDGECWKALARSVYVRLLNHALR